MKKGINIILILLVIVIYAKAFWPKNNISNNSKSVSNNSRNIQLINNKPTTPIPINFEFNDPFLDEKPNPYRKIKISNKKTLKKTKKTTTLTSLPSIIYLGRIHNPSTGFSKGLIQLNNKELIVQINDSISGFKITQINKTEIKLKSKTQNASVKKK